MIENTIKISKFYIDRFMFDPEIKRAHVASKAKVGLPALCVGEFKFQVLGNNTIVLL